MMDRKKLTWIISGIGLAAIFVGPVIYYVIMNPPK
jgi:hypothetical protein